MVDHSNAMIVAHDAQRHDATDALLPIYSTALMPRITPIPIDSNPRTANYYPLRHVHTIAVEALALYTIRLGANRATRSPIYASRKIPKPPIRTPTPNRAPARIHSRRCPVTQGVRPLPPPCMIHSHGPTCRSVSEPVLLTLRGIAAHFGTHVHIQNQTAPQLMPCAVCVSCHPLLV